VNFSYELPAVAPSQIVTGTFGITLTSAACNVFGNAQAS
jgi:hypothetical protein